MKFDPDIIQPLLKTLVEVTDAFTVDVLADDDGTPLVSWISVGAHEKDIDAARNAVGELLASGELAASMAEDPEEPSYEGTGTGLQLIAAPVRHGDFRGVLCAVRKASRPWTRNERELLSITARMCSSAMEAGVIRGRHDKLDSLVTYVASQLMGVQATDIAHTVHRILNELGKFFGADHVCIRKNDADLEATVLLDEWPQRPVIPDPDPLGVVPWNTDNSIFALLRDLRSPLTMRPGEAHRDYQELVKAGAGVDEVSLVIVPLLRGDATIGALSLNHFSDRIWTRDEVGALGAIAAMFVQLDQRVTAEANLHYQAYHDELTGLWNRRAFVEDLSALLADKPKARLAVLFADMDRLKTVNDVLGHRVGDSFIKAVSERLRGSVRPQDMVARLAGDEFVVVLHGVETIQDAEHAARRILDRVADPIEVGGHSISRSASIGVVVNGDSPSTFDELLGNADVALLEAKERGGDTVVAFNDELRSKLLARADLELRLRSAISNNEMRLYYQPEFDLRDGRMTGVEALVRWQHPDRGLLAADSFISLVEEINLAAELGRWVLREACRQLAEWKRASPFAPPLVRVNISAGELISSDFVGFIDDTLNRHGLAPAELGIEITESTVMRELDDVQATLSGLRSLGVTLAIDDFGTGYSSLAQLKQLPVDILKIDRSFVSSLAENVGDRAIVAAIVRLAEAFNLVTIAEGVEDPAAVTTLIDLGCHRAQGFFMAKPLPAHAVLERAQNPGIPLQTSL